MTTQDDLPTAVWEGSFIVAGREVKCVVLDDGRRIIETESLDALMADSKLDETGWAALHAWCHGGANQ